MTVIFRTRTSRRRRARPDTGDQCVQVGALDRSVALRDSKDREGPKLIVSADDWREFARRVKASDHDLA